MRTISLVLCFTAALTLLGCRPSTPPRQDGMALQVWRQTNAIRREHGLLPLELRDDLNQIARAHNEQMVERELAGDRQAFDHRDHKGHMVEDRIEAYRSLLGKRIDWVEAGENLARNRNFDDPVAEAVRGWLGSKEHRANLLSKHFDETGIAVHRSPQSKSYYFTQIFVRRMPEE